MKPRHTEALVEELIFECDRQAMQPPLVEGVPDRYISMFACALKDCLEVMPDVNKEHLAYAVNIKESAGPFPASFIFNHMLRDVQMRSLRYSEDPAIKSGPYPYETQEEWNERLSELTLVESEFKYITHDMIMWNVGSDVETRAAGLLVVAHTLLRDQVNDPNRPFSILNVGSARDHSLAMLVGDDVAFPEVQITGYESEPEKQRLLQQKLNELLARKIHLGDSYGVDLRSLREPEWSEYLESCRFSPSELLDPVKRSMYKKLEDIRNDSDILFHVDDDYGVDNIDFGRRFNLVAYFTCLYQSYSKKQRLMFDRGLVDVNDDGIMLIQDFCEVNEAKELDHPIERLKFVGPTSKPYTYGLFKYIPKKPELGVQVVGWWNNGRCEKFMPDESFTDSLLAA